MQSRPPLGPKSGFYPGPGKAFLLAMNQSVWLLEKQLVTPNQSARADGSNGSATIAVQVERLPGQDYPWGLSVQVFFTDINGNASAPGTFEVDVQGSDIDADAQFCLEGSGISTVNGSQVGRFESTTFWARYIRAFVKTLPNPVYVSILATR